MSISIDECVRDALSRLSPQVFNLGDGITQVNGTLTQTECDIHVWPQEWDDSGCGHADGFHEMTCGVMTKALTFVVIGPMMDACVYHNGELAYAIKEVNERFLACIQERNMPAKSEALEMEPENVKA